MSRFKKGKSGNPGGRPKVVADVRDLARQQSPAAFKELGRLALKAKSEPARLAAIREILDRAYGKAPPADEAPPVTVNSTPENNGIIKIEFFDGDTGQRIDDLSAGSTNGRAVQSRRN